MLEEDYTKTFKKLYESTCNNMNDSRLINNLNSAYKEYFESMRHYGYFTDFKIIEFLYYLDKMNEGIIKIDYFKDNSNNLNLFFTLNDFYQSVVITDFRQRNISNNYKYERLIVLASNMSAKFYNDYCKKKLGIN